MSKLCLLFPDHQGKATIPLVYVDPSAPVEQTNGGFKVAEQGEAAFPTVYRTPVAAKSIKGTPWVFGPAGITSPSGRFLVSGITGWVLCFCSWS
jgi:hypothetical protein